MATDRIAILLHDISCGFPKGPPPKYGEITVETTWDGAGISSDFEGKGWWEISADLLRDNYDALPLFTARAYRYYLPAYLINALSDFTPRNLVLEFAVYSLSPTKTKSDDPRISERRSQFSTSEKALIRRFLSLILEDENMYGLFNDAELALRKFWT